MNLLFSHSPPNPSSIPTDGIYKRQRSGSVSGRLRSASDLCEDGTISASQKGLVKDLIISNDPNMAEALEAYERGNRGPIKAYLNSGAMNRRSSIDLVAELGMDGLDMNMFDFQDGQGGASGGSSFDISDDMDMPFSFYDDPSLGVASGGGRGHAASFSIDPEVASMGGGINPARERTFSQIFDNAGDNLFGDLGEEAAADFNNSFHSGSIDVTDYETLLDAPAGSLGALVGGPTHFQRKKKAISTKKSSPGRSNAMKAKASAIKKGSSGSKNGHKGFSASERLDATKKRSGSTSGSKSSPISVPGKKSTFGTTSKIGSTLLGGALGYGGINIGASNFNASSALGNSSMRVDVGIGMFSSGSAVGGSNGMMSSSAGGLGSGLTIGVNHSFSSSGGLQGLDESVRVGAYSPASRRARIARFMAKRKKRIWTKRVKYDVRKNFADSRLRVKGRFVKKEDEELLRELMNMT
jgi:hypothetical protein